MPVATITPDETERFNLSSVKEGWVVLRHMTYGQWLHRRDIATRMSILGDPRKDDSKISLDTIQTEVTLYEFSKCIVEHNLEDTNGNLLKLGTREDFDKLHPKIGDEISQLIANMNAWESDAEEVFLESEQA